MAEAKKEKSKSKGGRPSLYQQKWSTEEGLLRVAGWAKDGLTNEQIAAKLGISDTTLYEWQNKYPEFAEALKTNKEVADRRVENALYKRALGYTYDECTYEPSKETGEMVMTKRVTKHVAPDVTAQIFWSKNRKPVDWRDKQQIEHSGELKNPFAALSSDVLKKLIQNG